MEKKQIFILTRIIVAAVFVGVSFSTLEMLQPLFCVLWHTHLWDMMFCGRQQKYYSRKGF